MLDRNHQGLAWIAAIALFMQSLDATILNTALPAIANSFHTSALQMQLAIISYALSVAAFIPLSGWLADRFGTLKIFRFAILLFGIGSFCCAIVTNLPELVMARVLQGIGGSFMMPIARLAIIRTVPKTHLMSVWNLMAMSGLIGPILGPILGGWLVTYASWHWIFLINIPIALFGFFIAKRYMPNVFGERSPLDWIGFILFSIALIAFTLSLDLLSENQANNLFAIGLFILGLVLFAIYYLYAKGARSPLFSLSLFHIRTFKIGMLINLLTRLTGSGIPFLLPLMFQLSFGLSAEIAGWLLVPIAIASILVKPFINQLVARFSYKRTLLFSSLSVTLCIALMAGLQQNSPMLFTLLLISGYGFSMSILFTAINTLTICDLEKQNASAGSTILSMAQQVGIGIGIAVASIILNAYRNQLEQSPSALLQAFSYTYLTLALIGLLLASATLFLYRQDGENLIH